MTDAGRVIAGTARGIRLVGPTDGTRPLADRVKETLFAILEPDLPDARVLDLFAGSGAAGIEALSRGAAHATFVDRGRDAVQAIRTNLRRAHIEDDRAKVTQDDVIRWLGGGAAADGGPYDITIVDPPYGEPDLLQATLGLIGTHVPPGARVVAKHFWRDVPPAAVGLLASERERRFGDTALTFYRRTEGG
jgi:16S rRNA (guanine(966)-N(2))-methyltransferase RsmD